VPAVNRLIEMGRQVLAWRLLFFGATVCALAFIAACHALGPPEPPPPPGERDVLRRDEIMSSTARQGDLFDAIQSLRPRFLSTPRGVVTRSSTSSSPVAVFVEGIRQTGGLEVLRQISAAKVAEVRYLDPMSAQGEYGFAATGGALLVKLYQSDFTLDTIPPP
jgi:hypothetical protein